MEFLSAAPIAKSGDRAFLALVMLVSPVEIGNVRAAGRQWQVLQESYCQDRPKSKEDRVFLKWTTKLEFTPDGG
jgi:hypothetical protein